MTSPSLRKPPITRRSMLRSICASCVVAVVAAASALCMLVGPAQSEEQVAVRSRPPYASSREKSLIARSASDAGDSARVKPAAGSRRPTSAPRRSKIVTTGFQESKLLEPAPDMESGPKKFVKPFRKIADIIPYDTYDPISTPAERERCPSNLCPCPEGAECPECCPDEDTLRRLGREKGEPDRPFVPRNFAPMNYCWEPTNMYHNPIYLEDVSLERYGHTRHYLIQPFFSGAKFFVQLVGLPYQMTIYPICSRQYSVGYYRPGECAPYKYYQIPLNAEAALVEAGLITGGYFIFAPGVGP